MKHLEVVLNVNRAKWRGIRSNRDGDQVSDDSRISATTVFGEISWIPARKSSTGVPLAPFDSLRSLMAGRDMHLGGRSIEPAGWRRCSYQLMNRCIAGEFAEPFVWIEDEISLRIEFPPPKTRGEKVTAFIVLALVSILALPFPLFMLAMWFDEAELAWPAIVLMGAFEVLVLWFWRSIFRAVRGPALAVHPSVLTIKDGTLKLERAGPKGDLDIAWDLHEIADIRFCGTQNIERILLNMILHDPFLGLLTMRRESLVRISVMLPSGIVEDALFAAPHGRWIEDCERRVRSFLRLVEEA